jgi:hypothetical protein
MIIIMYLTIAEIEEEIEYVQIFYFLNTVQLK